MKSDLCLKNNINYYNKLCVRKFITNVSVYKMD